jgi:Fe2+ transport system protein B
MKITPQEIMDKVSVATPYLADKVRDSFKDNEVHWGLTFSSINDSLLNEGLHTVICYSPYRVQVIFDVDLEKYPAFKSLDKEKSIDVIGKIDVVDQIGIKLKEIAKVEFLEDEKETGLSDEKKATNNSSPKNEAASDKASKTSKDFLKQIILHPAYSLLILALIVFLIFYATGINLKDFTL